MSISAFPVAPLPGLGTGAGTRSLYCVWGSVTFVGDRWNWQPLEYVVPLVVAEYIRPNGDAGDFIAKFAPILEGD